MYEKHEHLNYFSVNLSGSSPIYSCGVDTTQSVISSAKEKTECVQDWHVKCRRKECEDK